MKYSSLNKLVEDSIAKEKDMKPNPFMTDRIMAAITDNKQRKLNHIILPEKDSAPFGLT